MATTWADAVWDAATSNEVFSCCAHCADDAVCSDDHDWPCPTCWQDAQEARS